MNLSFKSALRWLGLTAAVFAMSRAGAQTAFSAKSMSANEIDLSWSAAAGVSSYKLYRNGALIATLPGTQVSYQDKNLSAGTAYKYFLQAKSSEVSATTQMLAPAPQPSPSASGQTLFTTQVPQSLNQRDGATVNYELGMKFMATAAGQIKAIRFYKTSNETGSHIGRIFSSDGRQLAQVTFQNESASGWQQQTLSSPLTIAANTQYVVSVNTGNGYYVATNNGMDSRIANGNLQSVVGNNGVYGSVGSMPTSSYENSNYFRDVVFVASQVSSPAPAPEPSPAPAPVPAPAPSQISGPPLTFNDSRFANTATVGAQGLSNGSTLSDRSITVDGGAASILCDGSCTLNRVRVNSSEAVRITSGTILIQDSYLEATGSGDDHADVIQAYSPGSRGSLILRNTSIVAHNTAATAGIFIADSWKPDLVDLENVMFSGGPYGLRLHADGYAGAHLRMKNVCFVGPFMYGMYLIDSIVTIDEWTNVNECVIQDGKLVITRAIPHP
jgi:hypothetical protein